MSNPKSLWPYWLVFIACVAGVLWFSRNDIGPLLDELTREQPVPAPSTPEQRGPRYPLEPAAPLTTPGYDTEPRPLPPLSESDSYVRTLLNEIFGSDVDGMLAGDDLIGRFVASIDNLTAAKPARKNWPVALRMDAFKATPVDDGSGEFVMSDENYVRFDFVVNLITSPAPPVLAATYRRLYPLLQEAYVGLGYPEGYFNDRTIEVIDHLLSTPEPGEPIRLVQPRVFYQYADPQLEALSAGQKLLLRMGRANSSKLRELLKAVRRDLAGQG